MAAFAAAGITILAAGCTSRGTAASPQALGECRDLAVAAGRTPPPVNPARPAMGFDPYNTFGTTFDQSLIVAIVKAMVSDGMQLAGYRYVILDDGWQGARTPAGQITADPRRLPVRP